MNPGIYTADQLSNEAYHASAGLSSSDLKELLKSPRHWQAYKENKKPPTADQIKGTLVHTLLLEPDKFKDTFSVGDFNIRRGKEYEKALDASGGKTLITIAEHEQGLRMVDSVLKQAMQNEELSSCLVGAREQSFYWTDPATGILCKVRPDIFNAQSKSIVDIKTSSDASFDSFQRDMVDYMYFLSGAFYLGGVDRVLAEMAGINNFKFVVIEKTEPYPVAIYKLSLEAIAMGNKFIRKALNTYADAVSTATWAGYPKQAIEMGLPGYVNYKYSYTSGDADE